MDAVDSNWEELHKCSKDRTRWKQFVQEIKLAAKGVKWKSKNPKRTFMYNSNSQTFMQQSEEKLKSNQSTSDTL